jgi:hypothetical protein
MLIAAYFGISRDYGRSLVVYAVATIITVRATA